MTIAQAVRDRIDEILVQKKTTWYWLYKSSGMSEGTVSGVQYVKNKGINLTTIVPLIRTLGVTVQDFFNSPIFDDDNIDCE